ncbi:MAG TPA: DNA recombination protein RmuC [Acidisarcina sp.]|nr:DNA recombination protein RmuC [Acidisarcina sp.]
MTTLNIAVVVAFVVGALLAWIVASGRGRKDRDAALAEMKSEWMAQLAVRESNLQSLRDEEYRQRAELAQLREQSLRLPELKQELSQVREQKDRLEQEAGILRQDQARYESTQQLQQQQLTRLERELAELKPRYEQALAEQRTLSEQLAETRTSLEAERSQIPEKVALLQGTREQLSDHFSTLANNILEEKTRRFTEQNQTNLGQLLDPLKVQLEQFRGRVDEVYVQESKDRSALSAQVQHLMALNQQLSEDADNLTKALKGSSKTQGNWGELILERVLEAGGLRKGEEYTVQDSRVREDGSRGQPDVVINLPEERHLVIDAKVSLTAYEEHVNADTDLAREAALERHTESIRSHIKGLSSKTYQNLYGLETLDFVIMFLPIEPAFMLAISRDPKLWQEAWQKNVLMVSPSTLLFVVRTVSHLWRQEKQNRSVQEIVTRGALLYDKLCGFVGDLTKVGERLTQAESSYEEAFKKLSAGTGNVVWQAEKLKDLGVKPSKALPRELVSIANGEQRPEGRHGETLALESESSNEEPVNRESDPGESDPGESYPGEQFSFAAVDRES